MQIHAHKMLPQWLKLAGSLILLLMFSVHYGKKLFFNKGVEMSEDKKVLSVAGMTCNHCSMTVKKAVESVQGTTDVEVDLNANKVYFKYDLTDMGLIKKAIEDKGYSVD